MSLSSVSISRPVFTIVLSIVIIIFGVIGFNLLGIREYPSVDPPIITVSASYTGANADIIESQITEPLEEAINGIAGIRTITSVSKDGASTITVEFELDVDLETAANDVRDKVSGAVRHLPADMDAPSVRKADADASPIMFITIQSDERSLLEISDIGVNIFKERLQTVPGISSISVYGEREYSMRLWLDPARLSAYGITPLDIKNVLDKENVELPSGFVEGTNTELSIRTLGRLNTPEEYNNLVIKEEASRVIRFRDIGRAELGALNEKTLLRYNGEPMVVNAIVPQPGSNHIEIADGIYARLEQISKDLPADVHWDISFDATRYIRESILEVQQTIGLAFILVVLIIFLFLRDWRTTIIPVLVIPISLTGTFFILYILGYSINVLTLLGVVLAIGLVVDDAIVVLENIYSKIEKGMQPLEAGFKGSEEIFFAVISTTVALVAVFMPILFLEGITGRLFKEFGITIASAVIISSFVALTLTPMLSSRILKKRKRQTWMYRVTEPFFEKLTEVYKNSLESFMKVRWLSFVFIILSFVGIYFLQQNIKQELAPLEDRSGGRMSASGPEGASFEYMDQYVQSLIKIVQEETPELVGLVTVTSPGHGSSSSVNTASARLVLAPPSERTASQSEIIDRLNSKLKYLTDARGSFTQEQTIGNRRARYPVQFVIQANTLEKLKGVLETFELEASNNPAFNFVDVNLKFTKPELIININREKANDLGVSIADVAQTLQLGISGQRFGYFMKNGKQYEIIGQVNREDRNDPVDIKSLFVKNDEGNLIQLDNLIETNEQSTPPQLYRYNRYVAATVSATLSPGYSIGDGIDAMEGIADKVLDDSFSTSLDGTSKDFKESSSSIIFAFLLALILVYLVLAAQFESFRDPLIIMFTVPLALAGALFSLWYYGETINVFSQIGIIMLIGLVTKNAILIVEFANQKKAGGLNRVAAVVEASSLRFRAILMTALSTVLGILPIALALGAGSESRVSMGIAVVGGMMFSTLLTLYVIPAVYSYISGKTKRIVDIDEINKKLKELSV
ncbi:efflux RND transporter permease subunit [Chondrinema litorale]|uniref:efflux RND transporter permease subunit n=1 Tax=Chondrinema litorale TaxID=2994555 RepID=UPI0025435A13|nr:efflux RND transporter permease subunit [Chondrinema litorale]UZR92581.1 efflux RND transporter permease subunit [Chondrinema litorale]